MIKIKLKINGFCVSFNNHVLLTAILVTPLKSAVFTRTKVVLGIEV